MIVCHCRVVTSRAVETAVATGAQTLAKVCQSTGAGSDCGSCVFTVKAIVTARAGLAPRTATLAPVAGADAG